ncbi:VOC family protein [Robertkochia aurantiaca]|uniref:VOC family protein n=1 Tax=Robertkochia aurantiaca TaxID=2873700 RepID=UPI001CCEB875|nr:VOC family protein [Robertkochia sp. 3YJGBD-33]
MKLGAFSVSLAVKDLDASRKFYEDLGFSVFAGDSTSHYLIMKNEQTLIGLFEGMFQENILTFNPGWNQEAEELSEYTDVREIQNNIKSRGIALERETDTSGSGPGSIVLKDPDGNVILIDQHV